MLKISNKVGRIDNFLALARKLSFLPTELDIFDTALYTYPIYLSTFDLPSLLFLTPTNMNLAVYGIGLAFVMTS